MQIELSICNPHYLNFTSVKCISVMTDGTLFTEILKSLCEKQTFKEPSGL